KIRKLIETKNFPALNDLLDTFGNNSVTAALKKLPALFGGEEVFEKAEKLMPDENIKMLLDELRDIYNDAVEICGNDGEITVDLGLVNKTDYYTGLIIKGYLQGHGDAVVSGGRYDKLISEFGYDVPAVGFAVNVNAVAKVIEKNGVLPGIPHADVVVFAEQGCEVAAIKAAQELREQGLIVENALFDDIESVREYAKEKKISRVVVIDSDNSKEELE
ncbi:MAG: ATP phosphoribosyltransferase regulatory subunit, partial [Ruminococcus sp.]|nr:ATP phosphoribosyltransferase regulatory subunit [Ruminococcus sp.]